MWSSTRMLPVLFLSRNLRIRPLLLAVMLAACVLCAAGASHSHSVTPDGASSVDQAVPAFMQTVSHSVTQDGPMAWVKYFDASPAFFMAFNGQMAFPNVAAAQEGTRTFAQTICHIELKWGDLRVDPLENEFAVVAVSWRETKSTPPVTALPDLQSIARDNGSSATPTGLHPFPPTSPPTNWLDL